MISDPAVFVEEWQQLSLPGPAEKLSVPALDPARTALLVIDLNRGFAEKGALYSPLSRALLPGVAELLADFRERGIQALLFTDTHSPDSPEFLSYPPHCVKGTEEEEVCPELLAVQWGTVLPKNSTNACLEPVFLTWLEEHDAVDTFVLVGCCTDICVQQAALTLKTWMNRQNRNSRVIVLRDLVATFEGPSHPAALCGAMALQNMAQSGVEILEWGKA